MNAPLWKRWLSPVLVVAALLGVGACGGASENSSPGAPASRSGAATPASIDYRAALTPRQRTRYERFDKFRSIDSCGFVDRPSVTRFLSAPLYVGPTVSSGVTGCTFELNPTKTPLSIDSFTVDTTSILEPNRKPDEVIARTAVYVTRLGASCTLSVVSKSGLLVGLSTSQAGQTQLFGPQIDVCAPIRGVLTASLPRLRSSNPGPSGVARSKGARLDPCVAFGAVRDQYPQAATVQADSGFEYADTTTCQIGLTGNTFSDKGRATINVGLTPVSNTLLYDSSYSTLEALGIPGSEAVNKYTACNVELLLGFDQPPIKTTSWTTLKSMNVSEKDSEEVIDTVKVYGTDCPTAERIAVAVAGAYQHLK